MNKQPFATPPRHWSPHLNNWLVRLVRPLRLRALRRKQKIVRIDVDGLEPVRKLLSENAGILIAPNHSFHYDSYVLFEAAHRLKRPFHFMTAWQVFAMSNRLVRWWMQKHGCFSIDRENTDMQAFRQAVGILKTSPSPLVIFPEGDIYHTNDRVTPFREGAASIALSAARRGNRTIACVPCALKCWYKRDPMPDLVRLMERLEERLLWRPRSDLPLEKRLSRLAQGVLALKEIEFLGKARPGSLRERSATLADTILRRQELRYGLRVGTDDIPERVKELRRAIIERQQEDPLDGNLQTRCQADMEDLFFVIQLYSYPTDYLIENSSVERLAETMDKFEEDLLGAPLPSVRGKRQVIVRFGEPIVLPAGKRDRRAAAELTETLQRRVQELLDGINQELAMKVEG